MDLPKLCTTRLFDQNFGMCISPQDILVPFFSNNATNYYRPWKLCEEIAKQDFGSTIDNTKDKFKITLDVQHFRPEEVSVKVNDQEVIIEGKHAEKEDDHGFISRQFVRRYLLPKDCLTETLSSTFSSDGILSIIASKKSCKEMKEEGKTVPIQIAGPCRKTETANKCEVKDMCGIKKEQGETKKATCEIKKDQGEIKQGTFEMMKEKAEIKQDKCETKKDKCETKKDKCETKKDKCEMQKDSKDKTENQLLLKENHSRLLKPELLGEAISGTEKLLSESRKETDELLRLMSAVQSMPNPTEEKLDLAIGQCKAAMKELKKDIGDSNMSAISEMAMGSSEMSSSRMESAEMSSMKSSVMSETIETSMSSSTKMTSGRTSDLVSETICAELKEAAAENA